MSYNMLSFSQYLLESAQKGYVYEENVAKLLAEYDMVRPGYKPAGASHDRPDLDIYVNNREHGVELKMSLASAGSLVIHYEHPTGYVIGDTGDNPEKIFIKELAEFVGVSEAIKRQWKGRPFIQKNRDQEWVEYVKESGLSLRERYDYDVKNFRDIYFDLPSDSISKYYNLKKTYYLNVGTHGLFLLGNSDPAEFNKCADPKVPLWDKNHKAVLRVRIQSKGVTKAAAMEERVGWPSTGGQGYQITMEMQFRGITASPYNIGPVKGKGPAIDRNKLVIPCQ